MLKQRTKYKWKTRERGTGKVQRLTKGSSPKPNKENSFVPVPFKSVFTQSLSFVIMLTMNDK